jgi:PPE-repeat protein
LVANNFLGQNTGAIATNEAEYLDMWIQDALTMDTYQVNSQQASALPEQTAAPQVASGAVANAAAASSTSTSTGGSTIIEGLLGDLAQLFGVKDAVPASLAPADLVSWLGTVATGIAGNPTAALFPVQVFYYMGMMSSMPARMFMSSGSSAASAGGSLADGGEALLANVGKLVDGKLANVMGGVSGQLRSWGSSISASLASAQHLGGLSVPNAWHGMAPEMARSAPVLPGTSVAAPTMTTGLPSSPFAQSLMGALAGRGVSSLGSRVAAKVMPRSPAGG